MAPRRSNRTRGRAPSPERFEAPAGRHPCLRFGLLEEETRYQFLCPKALHDAYYMTTAPFQAIGIQDYIESRIPVYWRRLLTLQRTQYHELVLEFYTTYSFDERFDTDAQTISFRLKSNWYHISLRQFAEIMGIYTEDEMPERLGITFHLTQGERTAFWQDIAGMYYSNATYKASHIRDPRVRILHRIVATAFYARLESAGNANHKDMDFLYSVLEGRHLCPARTLAASFTTMAGKQQNQSIAGGAFVTRLAEGLGLMTDEFTSILTPIGRRIELSLQTFINIGTVGQTDDHYYLIDRNGFVWHDPEAIPTADPHQSQQTPPFTDHDFGGPPDGFFGGSPPYGSPSSMPHFSSRGRSHWSVSSSLLRGFPSQSPGTSGPRSPPPETSEPHQPPPPPYYPPREFYDNLTSRFSTLDLINTRLGNLETEQQAMRNDIREVRTELQAHVTDQNARWAAQAEMWTQQASYWQAQADVWTQFTGEYPQGFPPRPDQSPPQ